MENVWQSSEIFGKFWKRSKIVFKMFGKSSEIFRSVEKFPENFGNDSKVLFRGIFDFLKFSENRRKVLENFGETLRKFF